MIEVRDVSKYNHETQFFTLYLMVTFKNVSVSKNNEKKAVFIEKSSIFPEMKKKMNFLNFFSIFEVVFLFQKTDLNKF